MLYLHCGWPRTGTSSLQNALHENRERLAEEGIVFPGKVSRGTGAHNGVDEFMRFLALHADDNVLISAEGITTALMLNKSDALPRLLETAREVTQTRCIWSLRRIDALVCSLYMLRLRRGEKIAPPDQFLAKPSKADLLFAGMRRMEAAVNGDVAYVRYDPEGAHNDELLHAFGFPDGARASIIRDVNDARLNASPTQKQAAVLLNRDALSARAGVELDGRELREAFRRGEFSFENDRRCELVDDGVRRDLHEKALAAARRQDFAQYTEFFGDAEIAPSSPTPLEPEIVSDEDLAKLVTHFHRTPRSSAMT